MTNPKKRTYLPFFLIGAVFALICLFYVGRLIALQFDTEKTRQLREASDVNVTTEPIRALRGNICDRNGVVLVTNKFTYEMVLDYDKMPYGKREYCESILGAVRAIDETGNRDKRADKSFPLTGTYPDMTYLPEVADPDSTIALRLSRILSRLELPADTTAGDLAAYYVKRYALLAKEDGARIFSDRDITDILPILYEITRVGFSAAQPLTLASGVDLALLTYTRERGVAGVDFRSTSTRTYCYPGYASHILGRIGAITAETWEYYKALGYAMNDTVGIDGCEAAFEKYLRGKDGVLTTERNAKGEIVRQYVSTEPVPGKDVYLTIDIRVQIAAENELKAYMEDEEHHSSRGASVAIDPKDGGLLVLASYPTYDLSTFSEDYEKLAADENQPLINRATSAIYAPGSTFKVGVSVAALEEKVITTSDRIYCGGIDPTFRVLCTNAHAVHHISNLTVIDALAYSCNTFFIELGYGNDMNDTMTRYCRLLGLGQKTGIELPESLGQIACRETAEKIGADWTPYERGATFIGQSIHQYTPLQVGNYITTVANGGTRYAVHLLHSVHTVTGETVAETSPEVLSTVGISDATLDTVKEGMKRVVDLGTSATYYMYTVQGIDVTVCGKSGTAQVGDSQNCWFAAFAPREDPQLVVTSIAEDASTGASVSQIDAAVLGTYLRIQKEAKE